MGRPGALGLALLGAAVLAPSGASSQDRYPSQAVTVIMPFTAGGVKASTTSPRTWSSFEAARATYQGRGYDGVGFVLGAGWAGVDLDSCRDAVSGASTPTAKIGSVGATMNYAYVKIEGVVTRGPI